MHSEIASVVAPKGIMQLFLEDYCSDQIKTLLTDEDNDRAFLSLEIDMHCLLEFNYELALSVLTEPKKNLSLFNEACVAAQQALKQSIYDLQNFSVKEHVQIRVANMPNHPVLQRKRVPKSKDIGKLLCLTGTVIRTGKPKMLEVYRHYLCLECRGIFKVEAQIEKYNFIRQPTQCLAAGRGVCGSSSFQPVDGLPIDKMHRCIDFQEILIQEQESFKIPRQIPVLLDRDLVDQVQTGDLITVTGVTICRWRLMVAGERPDISMAIRANNIKVHADFATGVVTNDIHSRIQEFNARYKDRPMHARDIIIDSMCPQVYGLFYAKLAVLLILISGVSCDDSSGMHIRGEPHMLMVGDAGTAKSQLLKYAAKLMPRAVLTTGMGSTSAGLTASAVKAGPEWQLEAGALVLADRGLCCIDEFGSFNRNEQNAVLEAMEQQSVSVNKGGFVCKLNARCSVLAAMNFRGRYDIESSLSVNTALPTSLLSRFDLVLVLLDMHDEQWDAQVSTFLLNGSRLVNTATRERWSFEQLQAYIACVKTALKPTITPVSEQVLTHYYRIQRQRDSLNAARTTTRLLESLIRLAQAHARLMFRDKVLLADAVMAVVLMESTMLSASVLGVVDTLHTTIPDDSDMFYGELEKLVLRRLGLAHLRM